MRRRDLLRTGVGLAATSAADFASPFRGPALAATPWKASDVHAPGYPTVVAVENIGKKLEAFTNGRLSLQMFPSMALGGEKETIEQTRIGAVQIVRVSVGALGPVVREINVLNLPFLFRNTQHMRRVIDGPIGSDLLDKVTANDKAELVGLCWMDAGARSLYNSKKPIRTIEDLKGMKFRVIGNSMFLDMMKALGGQGVAFGYDQVFSALQTGAVDGAENNPPSFVFDNHYKVAKYYSLTEHLIVPEILVFSKRVWRALPPDDRSIMRKLCREAQFEERDLWTDYEKRALDEARAAGVEITEITDKKPFQDAVRIVWDRYAPDFQDMLVRIEAFS
jgi:tripartite ATP-independent transporter DctP family solute receptor